MTSQPEYKPKPKPNPPAPRKTPAPEPVAPPLPEANRKRRAAHSSPLMPEPDKDALAQVREALAVVAEVVSPDWIIGAGTDRQGHSARVWGHVTPTTKGLIETLVASKVCPAFKSQSEVVRAGVWFVVQMLGFWKSGQVDQVESLVVRHCIIESMIVEEQNQIDFEKTFNDLRTVINHHIGKGHYDHAKKFILNIQAQIDLMPEGHWKEQYNKKMIEFDTLFGGQSK
jgi:hypothetical protein